MTDVIEFVQEHLNWIIASGVVLLMIIIGYFAEKTDFGRKKNTTPRRETVNQSVNEPTVKVADADKIEQKQNSNVAPNQKETEKAMLEKTEVIDVAAIEEKAKEEKTDDDVWQF